MYDCFCNVHWPVFYTLTLLQPPARSFDFVPRYSLVTSLRMTECTAFYAVCLKRSLPTACRRCLVPRTDVIALHSLITRTAGAANNITTPRSGRRLRRAPVYCLKQIARARHPTLCWVMRIGAFAFAEHTKLSLASRKTVAFARMSGGNGARLQAAFSAAF